MGGEDASRGFLIQTMVAVISSLDVHEWETITLEPENKSEKADIFWNYPDKTTVAQVKSSRNQISLPDVKAWAEDLEREKDADEFELILIGTSSDAVVNLETHGKVRIPPLLPNNPKALLDQASHLLGSFLEKESLSPLRASALRAISMQLVTEFFITATKDMTREDLKETIKASIESNGHILAQDGEIIIKALTEQNKQAVMQNQQLNAELGLKAEQVEALTATIDELRDESLLDRDFEVAVDAMRKGDISVAESIFQGQIDEGSVELEQAYRNLGALNIFVNPPKAIKAYREATRLNAKNSDSWVQLGTLLLRMSDYDGAMSAYENLSSEADDAGSRICLLYTSPSPRDRQKSRMPSSA